MSQNIVVIGAGIVGVATGLQLQKDGHKVTIVDRGPPGEGTSKGNASVIQPEGVVPVPFPGLIWKVPRYLMDPLGPLAIRWSYLPKLTPWLIKFMLAGRASNVEKLSIALSELLKRSLESHQDLAKSAGCLDMIQPRGWMTIFEKESTWEGARAAMEMQRRRGVEVIDLSPDEVRQIAPALAPVYKRGALLPKVSHVVNNFRYVQVLAEAFVHGGGKILRHEVKGFDKSDGQVTAVRTDGPTLSCDSVIVACGAWSKPLARELGSTPPLDTERGYHLMLPNPGVEIRLPIVSMDYHWVATPLEHGLRFAGTDELGGLSLPPNWKRSEIFKTHAKRWFPQINLEGSDRWMGFRPSMPDSVPVIGRSPRYANAYFGFGHGHLGLTLGPRTGEVLADLIAGRDPGIAMDPYRIDRW